MCLIDNIEQQQQSKTTINDEYTIDIYADDQLIQDAAFRMGARLATKRAEGRSGWWDKNQCSTQHLRDMLKASLEKGDMINIANLAMMINARELARV